VERLQDIIQSTSRDDAGETDLGGRLPHRPGAQRPHSRGAARHDAADRRTAGGRRQERGIVMPDEGHAVADGDDSHFRNF
jgi:hypothetical protein